MIDIHDLPPLRDSRNNRSALDQNLLAELVTSSRPRRRALVGNFRTAHRQRFTRRLFPATAIAVAMTFVLAVGIPRWGQSASRPPIGVQSAHALVSFARQGEDVRLVFADLDADPQAINQELERHGIHATVELWSVSPSLVGKLIGTSEDTVKPGTSVEEQMRFEYSPGSTPADDVTAVTLPASLPAAAHFIMSIGRRARGGEAYAAQASSAQDRGEALHCHPIVGLSTQAAAEVLAKTDQKALWRNRENAYVPLEDVSDRYVIEVMPYALGVVDVFTTDQPGRADAHPRIPSDCPG